MKKKNLKQRRLKIAFWAVVAVGAAWVAVAPHTRISAPPSVTVKVGQPTDARAVQGAQSPLSQPSPIKGEGEPSSLIPVTDQTEPKTKWDARLRGHDGGLGDSYRSGIGINSTVGGEGASSAPSSSSLPSVIKGEGEPPSQPSTVKGEGEAGAVPSSQSALSDASSPASPPAPPVGGVTVPVAPEAEAPPSGKPVKIAIVVDDLGVDYRLSQKAIRLPAAVTLAFLPYGGRVRDLAKEARDNGHEILLHMPMEPLGVENPGQGALKTDLPLSEIQLRFQTALASFTGFDGVNNHMGSKFTAFAEGMNVVADEMLQRNLFFLDSRTNVNSIASRVAKEKGLPFGYRDVFLDDDRSPEAIRRQLALAKRIAQRKGYAVAIGHPHNVTLDVLEKWTADAAAEGVELVPVNAVVGNQ